MSAFKSVAADSPYRVDADDKFKIKKAPTRPPRDAPDKDEHKQLLKRRVEELDELQRMLYAQREHAVLLVFQAIDAAGKDSTIRAVLTGINPAGCEVYTFKQPSAEELDHDFLWRTTRCLPSRGRIGVFNRSYYEEVVVVRVHPEHLDKQQLPRRPKLAKLWDERYESIRDLEKHLARNGTLILKFFLNVSRKEQRNRLLERLDDPEKNWKMEAGDVVERARWKKYQEAFQDALRETSRPWAPWYAIPADDKPFMRATVADIIVRSLKNLKLHYPGIGRKERARFGDMRRVLEGKA